MKRYLAVALLALAIALGFATRNREAERSHVLALEAVRPDSGKKPVTHLSAPAERVSSRSPQALPECEREEVLIRIEDAVKTYESAAVKTIAPYLTDSDRDLRSAAREGLIQLGEPDGIAALRLAATRMSDPAETNACREAADFLELPSWSDTPAAREAVAEIIAHPEPPPP